MPDAERMTVDERRKCLKRMQGKYLAATRAERSRLLDDLAELTGLHRKSVVRLLKGPSLERRRRQRQRGRVYGAAVDDALRVIEHWLGHPQAQVVHSGERHVLVLGRLLRSAGTAGNLTTDAHLAALAIEHGATVLTFDRDFARFEGVRWTVPTAK